MKKIGHNFLPLILMLRLACWWISSLIQLLVTQKIKYMIRINVIYFYVRKYLYVIVLYYYFSLSSPLLQGVKEHITIVVDIDNFVFTLHSLHTLQLGFISLKFRR
jgi:hypothetical protein